MVKAGNPGEMRRWLIAILILCLTAVPAAVADAEEWLCKVVSVQGTVQVRKAGAMEWSSVHMDGVLFAGDTLRTLQRSRAALLLRNDSIARIDENTTMTLVGIEVEKTSILDLIRGGGLFFNRAPSGLRVLTPYVNAGVEGTEFFLGVDDTRSLLSVFEGSVAAVNDTGALRVRSGQSVVAQAGRAPVFTTTIRPRDSVQWTLFFPPVVHHRLEDLSGVEGSWEQAWRESVELYRSGDLTGAFAAVDGISTPVNDPDLYVYRASLLLAVGRMDEAGSDLARALDLDPGNSHAHALRAIIAVTRNEKEDGLRLALRAVELGPTSSSALIALSYAQQAGFDLDGARESLRKAVRVQPADALAWARLAEMELSHGRLGKAVDAARQSVALDPELAHGQTILGFAFLTEVRISDSKQAFQTAIRLAPADPMPRLGLGLALIREGSLEDGRREIEIAAILDPERSLIRSYLGKAYFEEKRDHQAAEQLSMAKELDPLDPTPWLYDGVRKQTVNRPAEALHDLDRSIDLNDNRAVYRSRLMLDQDLAARSVNLARIYADLGFQQRALVEGFKSLSTNPANFSAHRFLSDAYAALPRNEIGRVSEVFQAQMLQPLNINPIQPRLAEGRLLSPEGTIGPAEASFSEYGTLFNRNRAAFVLGGAAGSKGIFADEVIQSGLYNWFSYSLGQQHFQSDGFRENNDQRTDLFNAFFQASLSPQTSVQGEYRVRTTEGGDLDIRFDPDNFFALLRRKLETDVFRLGASHAFSPQSKILLSIMHGNLRDKQRDIELPFPPPFNLLNLGSDSEAWSGEAQYLISSEVFHVISGFGHFTGETEETANISFIVRDSRQDIRHTNGYVYGLIHLPGDITWTVGASGDFFDNETIDTNQFNPKFGMLWNITPDTTLRAAAFRALTKSLINSSTLEPTQVAGFNQFYDDADGARGWKYGVAVDQKFRSNVFGGVEYSYRDLEVPIAVGADTIPDDRKEALIRSYLYWVLFDRLALSAEYQFERFTHDEAAGVENFFKLETHRVPLGVGFFHPSGFLGNLKATFVSQSGEFPGLTFDDRTRGRDQFWVVDGSIGYRLPNRWGMVSLEVRNLLDERFRFQDTDPANPTIFPELTIFGKITLSF
jgi:tetratricopeptide (TPR) repeat protein